MSVEINKETNQITYDKYVKQGSMMCLREALEADNPEQLYNYLKNNGVEKPELYNVTLFIVLFNMPFFTSIP